MEVGGKQIYFPPTSILWPLKPSYIDFSYTTVH
jgi:hypothetical protein